MDIENIMRLLEEGRTRKEIAEQLGVSYSKLNYHLNKERNKAAQHIDAAVQTVMPCPPEIDDAHLQGSDEISDHITIMPRDPSSLYVYWDITSQRKQMVEEHFHTAFHHLPKFLRVYDVTCLDFSGDHWNRSTDIAVHADSDNWFVMGMEANCTYIVDYGTTTLDGRFVTLLRSNTVTLPPQDESSWTAYHAVTLELAKPAPTAEWHSAFTGYSLSAPSTDQAEEGVNKVW